MLEPEGEDATINGTHSSRRRRFAATDDLFCWSRDFFSLEPANVFCCGRGVLRPSVADSSTDREECYNHVLKMLEPATHGVAFEATGGGGSASFLLLNLFFCWNSMVEAGDVGERRQPRRARWYERLARVAGKHGKERTSPGGP